MFALGLVATALSLRVLAEHNPSPSNGALEHLKARGAEYDVIVVGPSFVQMHFLPPVFDARLKELGHPLRSLGVGLSGLRGGELDYYLSRIARMDLPKLKHVLTDVTLDQARPLEAGNRYKRRVIYWHDPAQLEFMSVVIGTLKSKADWWKRANYYFRHLQHALLKAGNVGEGIEGLHSGALLGDAQKIKQRSQLHLTASQGKKQAKLAEKYLAKNKKGFDKAAKKLKSQRKDKKKKARSNVFARHYRDALRGSGAQAWFIISPILSFSTIERKVEGEPPLQLLDFNDPGRYPELYDAALHYDRSHLHYEGAKLFSTRLAEAFAAELDARAAQEAP